MNQDEKADVQHIIANEICRITNDQVFERMNYNALLENGKITLEQLDWALDNLEIAYEVTFPADYSGENIIPITGE